MSEKSKTYNFTSRGKTFGNFWLVYSNKISEVLNLKSDREVAHWALNLEFNKDVKAFQFGDYEGQVDFAGEPLRVSYRLKVSLALGVEYHKITSEKSQRQVEIEEVFDQYLWRTNRIRFKHVCDEALVVGKRHIFPLIKLSSFLSASKEQWIPPNLVDSAESHFSKLRCGTIKSYLTAMCEYNCSTAILLLYRFYNEGKISLSFDESPFELGAQWSVSDE